MMRSSRIALGLLLVCAASCSGTQSGATHNDAYVAVAVRAKLTAVDVNSATAVHVDVSNGRVTLSGEAQSQREQGEYVGAAKSVDGVVAVDDRLRVNPHMQGIRGQASDAALTASVATAIAGQTGINVLHVTPSARNGVVTLTGTVPTPAIRQTVLETARNVSGVKRVVDRLVVSR